MPKMKLMPFKIESIEEMTTEIPYGVELIEAPGIWEQSEKGEGIVIAILDTGIDKSHPDLKNQIIGGWNFTNEGSSRDYTDNNGHGTHVAGTIAAAETGSGVVGIAPKTKLLICKVLDGEGSGEYHDIVRGIKWATNWRGKNGERVRVMNLSLGGSYNDEKMYKAILKAVAEGILVVVASGNEGNNEAEPDVFEYGYPALYNECVTVAACDEQMKLAYFSNEHLEVDVIAPGIRVKSTYPGGYATLSGTSMATPHISGALALIINYGEKAFKRTLTESEIFALMVKCCCSIGYKKSSEGNGIPNLLNVEHHC